jgi:N-acetylglucosaminyl-diphospho-decaprenol L-rhamnosyltransferase
VLVTHDSADRLAALHGSLEDQLMDGDEVVLVDNASRDDTVARARGLGDRFQVIETGVNLGFASGCAVGAQATTAPLLLFLNPDCVAGPGCLQRLRRAAAKHPQWAAWQPTVMLEDGRINTSGGVIHFLGVGFAGDCERPVDALPSHDREIAFASGAALVVRRDAWLEMGGMDSEYFMYGEDLDLGLRLWLAGHQLGVVPSARVTHSYEFQKGSWKWYWLERNRWRTVLSVYPAPLLIALAPALALGELGLLALALRDGWLGAKLRSQWAALGDLGTTLRRRRRLQDGRRLTALEFARLLSSSLDSPYLTGVRDTRLAVLQARYWTAVLWLLARLPAHTEHDA